ncbi:hypothetical protein TYRP_017538 [Tyrophagus putrescentiae]|nr:hypothetical protein TYRP_017538 [Tyrophagus putrescentiae]
MSIARHFVLLAGRRPVELFFQPSKSTTGRRLIASTYAFALCRKALEMHQQDLAKAEKWLRAEALKQGWEKAERVKSRSTGEGLVGIYTSPDRRTAAMVERLSNFSSGAARDRGSCIHKRWIVDEGKLVELAGSSITEAISKLGENIRFVRGCIVHIQGEEEDQQQQKASASSNQVRLLPYTHAVAGKVASANPNVGSKLGQHIIGLTPLTVTPPPPSSESSASFEEATEKEITGEEEPTALLKQKSLHLRLLWRLSAPVQVKCCCCCCWC